jgi:hypothetical protein
MLFQDLIEEQPIIDTQKFCSELQRFVNQLTELQQENLTLQYQIVMLNHELDFAKKVANINSKDYSFSK